eukprot:128040-Rhodomonas_salina.1
MAGSNSRCSSFEVPSSTGGPPTAPLLSQHVCRRRSWLSGCSACRENVLEHLDREAARVVADSGSTPLIKPTRSKVLQHPKE